jgi:Zn-dependent protease with chaperone function
MNRSLAVLVAAVTLLAACDATITTSGPGPSSPVQAQPPSTVPSERAVQSFAQVVRAMEPVAEQECRARTRGVDCDFRVLVDDRPGQPPNAFQTLDKSGRPILAFTVALLEDARNTDELAFVFGHEAAHHIRGHIPRQQQNAVAGAVIAGSLAVLLGGTTEAVESAQRTGAQVGARSYSKEFELEADALGTIITARAGYNPLRGAEFFNRIPDPGNRFLGSHPPNAERIETVRRTAVGL